MSLWKLWVSLLWLTCNTDQLFEPRHVVNPFPFPHPFPLTFDSVFSGLFMEQGFIGRELHGRTSIHLITIGPYDFRNHRIVELVNKNIILCYTRNIVAIFTGNGLFWVFFEKQEHFCIGRTFLGVCNCVSLQKQSRTSPPKFKLVPGVAQEAGKPSKIAKLIAYPKIHDGAVSEWFLCAR